MVEQTKENDDEGRKAGQISIPPLKWELAKQMVRKGLFKTVSAVFENAFDDLANKLGLSLEVKVVEVDRKPKIR